jgi:hypothetical protein
LLLILRDRPAGRPTFPTFITFAFASARLLRGARDKGTSADNPQKPSRFAGKSWYFRRAIG